MVFILYVHVHGPPPPVRLEFPDEQYNSLTLHQVMLEAQKHLRAESTPCSSPGFRHQRRNLSDLSMPVRLAGLFSGAKLELLPPPNVTVESSVLVGIQYGEHLRHSLGSVRASQSLWNLLRQFERQSSGQYIGRMIILFL